MLHPMALPSPTLDPGLISIPVGGPRSVDLNRHFRGFVRRLRDGTISWGNAPAGWRRFLVEMQAARLGWMARPRRTTCAIPSGAMDFLLLEGSKNALDASQGTFPRLRWGKSPGLCLEIAQPGAIPWASIEALLRQLADRGQVFEVISGQGGGSVECGRRPIESYDAGDLILATELRGADEGLAEAFCRVLTWDDLLPLRGDWPFIRGLSTKGVSDRTGRALYEMKRLARGWGASLSLEEQAEGSAPWVILRVEFPRTPGAP